MIPYILVIITLARGGSTAVNVKDWPVVTFQRFGDAQACQLASTEIKKRANSDRLTMVCVPEVSK